MTEVNYTIEYNPDDLERFAILVKSSYTRAVELCAIEMWRNLGIEAPVDKGRLAGSFQLEKQSDLIYRIVSGVEYALYVNRGTGIYGPYQTPIRPVTAKNLVFAWKGKTWFLKQVKGQKANPYIDRAFDKTRGRIDEFIQRAIRESGGAA